MIDLSIFDLSGETAIVTGGSKGLGRSFALALAKAGADVAVASRSLIELKKVAEEIRILGRKAIAIQVDITNEDEVDRMVKKALSEFNKIDILVNNAGTKRINKSPEETSLKKWSSVMDTNVTGTFICSRAVGREMIKRKKGKIINIASISGFIINKGVHGGAYDCSKSAVVALTKVLAVEWAKYNININAIAPGYFRTKPNQALFEENPDFYKKVKDMIPLKRIGEPEELGGLAIFLASKASNFMTGTTIIIDGGYTLW